MITIDDVHKSFGLQEIFHGATLQINAGDRFAITGPNGAGKSTMLKILLGEEAPDSGEVRIGRGVKISYLPQEYPPVGDGSVLQEAMKDTHEADGRLEAKCKEILMGLGFKVADFDRPLKTLSGGWAMRVMMAKVLLEDADLLLLDEPTNHLDLQSLLWFQERLKSWRGAIVFISHDRAFVDAIAKAIVNVEGGRLKIYPGDYEAFVAAKASERERLETRYREQQVEIAQMEEFIMRNRARASTAGRAQSMIKRLEKLEKIELPAEVKKVHIKFPQPTRTGVRALALKDMHKSYGDLKVYQGLNIEFERGHKVAFVGPNGAGKSTMLKILAGVIPFDSGERTMGLNVNVGYYSQHRLEGLNPDNTVLKEALESNRNNGELMVRTVLGSFLFPGDSVFKKVGVLSGGEKSRLALVKLLLNPPNVMLMDEPTTHLDMASVDALIEALKAFEGTLCFISHDLYFINALADHVLHVDGGKVTWYPGNYDYFKRRQEQAAAEAPAAKPKAAASLPVLEANHVKAAPATISFGANHKHLPREERRRLAALAKRQEEIAALHAKVAEKTEKLQDPKIYENYDKVRKLSAEIEALQADLKKLETAN